MLNAFGRQESPSSKNGGAGMSSDANIKTLTRGNAKCVPIVPSEHDDPWDVFELDDEAAEPEPEYGDFWGELDNDCDNGN